MNRICLLLLGVLTNMIMAAQSITFPIIYEGRTVSGVFKHDPIASQYLDLFVIGDGLIDETNKRSDKIGKLAALLIIPTTFGKGVSFFGNIVGDIQYLNDSYYVYLSDGTHLIQIKTPERTINIDLTEVNIKGESLESGRRYYLCGLAYIIHTPAKWQSDMWNVSRK